MGIYWFGKSSLLLLPNIYFWLLIFSFKDLLSWNKLNALFLFQHFFLEDMTGPWAGPGVYFVGCQSIRISLKTFLSLFFFYHIKEESFHWANLTRSCLMKAQPWEYHLDYYRICIFAFFHWPLIVKYIKIFPFWNFKNLTFPSY